MELRHLRYFVAAAEAENVSRAALRVHVSQPALSRQLRDLEAELGFALFERSPKSVRLTAAGRTFLREARAVLERAEGAVNAARAVAAGGHAELHVGYAPSPTVRIIPPALRAFQAQMPNVRVRLHDASTEEMLAGVRDGKFHVALLVRPGPARLRGLQFEELTREALRLAVLPSHPLAQARSVTPAQASQEPLIGFNRTDYPEYYDHVGAWFATRHIKPRIAAEHDSAASLAAALESGAGVALVPESFSCSTGPRLKLIPLSPEPAPLVIGAVWAQPGLTPAGWGFLNAARHAAANLAPLS